MGYDSAAAGRVSQRPLYMLSPPALSLFPLFTHTPLLILILLHPHSEGLVSKTLLSESTSEIARNPVHITHSAGSPHFYPLPPIISLSVDEPVARYPVHISRSQGHSTISVPTTFLFSPHISLSVPCLVFNSSIQSSHFDSSSHRSPPPVISSSSEIDSDLPTHTTSSHSRDPYSSHSSSLTLESHSHSSAPRSFLLASLSTTLCSPLLPHSSRSHSPSRLISRTL
jgi:hypothetical protein